MPFAVSPAPVSVSVSKKMKDPEIKLFGRKISLPENVPAGETQEHFDESQEEEADCADEKAADDEEKQQSLSEKDHITGETDIRKLQEKDNDPSKAEEESENRNVLSESDNNPKTPSIEEDAASANPENPENDQADDANSQQKTTLKKPDKILPCPRCNSMDTKFCYYNNYNINQPRHFCKSCQRYWTAGGTMRNVPVGAGRRKNKNSCSHYRHITITEAFQAARIDAPNGFDHPAIKQNGTVLSFGPDSPFCESMSSVSNIPGSKVLSGIQNGYGNRDQGGQGSCKVGEKINDCASGLCVTNSSSMAEEGQSSFPVKPMQATNGFQAPVPCIPGLPWPVLWNPAVPMPAICPPGFPMSFCPSPYWNCGVPNAWNVPWLLVPSPTTSQKTSGSSPTSPLGKHSRDGKLLVPKNSESKEVSEQKSSESSIVVPKTLRIDDPDEAAKSSIWDTLGIKYDSISREGLFKALQPKSDDKKSKIITSPALHANPAALSRSISFQENARS